MRFINCTECGHLLIKGQPECPNCSKGSYQMSSMSKSTMALLMGFAIGACGGSDDTGDKETNTNTSTQTTTDSQTDTSTDTQTNTDTGGDSGMMAAYGMPYYYDNDQDDFLEEDDCDDWDPNTYPGAAENESASECMTDADGDGFGSMEVVETATAGTDCDDTNPDIHPNAEEIVGDEIDSNCNGDLDN